MKKFPLFHLVTLATAALLSTASAQDTNGIAAVVNGRPILRSEVEEVIKVQTLMHESNLSFDVLIHVVFVYLICFVQPDSYVNVESNIIVIFDIYVSVEWQISL